MTNNFFSRFFLNNFPNVEKKNNKSLQKTAFGVHQKTLKNFDGRRRTKCSKRKNLNFFNMNLYVRLVCNMDIGLRADRFSFFSFLENLEGWCVNKRNV